MIDVLAPLFREEWIGSGEVYLPGGQSPKHGARLCNKPLAATYRRIIAEAEAAAGLRSSASAKRPSRRPCAVNVASRTITASYSPPRNAEAAERSRVERSISAGSSHGRSVNATS